LNDPAATIWRAAQSLCEDEKWMSGADSAKGAPEVFETRKRIQRLST